ncbi:hypothetical protein ACKF11_13285 [Methylobacillus sp. Pita2]|uniref:hypothetical protein n=1 Tax=Methylobacillus sp. Pita2 TaxID=3383245 RepID=UPI0038B4408F
MSTAFAPNSFEIDEAARFEFSCGTKFEDTREGAKIIAFLRQLANDENRAPIMPMNVSIGRKEDMSANGRIQLFRQDDGDVCIEIIDEEGTRAGIEFCTSFGGGGRSPKTLAALLNLGLAIMEDNEHDSSRQA